MNLSHSNTRRLSITLTAGALVALGLLLYRPVMGDFSRVLITEPIDESKLVTTPRSVRFEAVPKNDRGPVPDSFPLPHMLLQLKRSPEMEAAAVQYADEVTDKKSPNFRHWLTAKEIGDKWGPSEQDVNTITHWLESHGFVVHSVHPNRLVIDFSGTAATLREAFHTEVHYLEVNGTQHFANMTNPRIPAALSPAVMGIVSIHDFRPHANLVPKAPNYYIGTNEQELVPADFQTIYNINPLLRQGIDGRGQTVTILEDSDSYSTDVATYRTTFLGKYTLGSFTTVHPGSCNDPGTNGDDSESDLDGEVASAMAPNANIVMAVCPTGTTFGGLIALENLVATSAPSIVSMSYGICEAANALPSNAAFNTAFQTASIGGSSIFVSTGDGGSSTCAGDFTNGNLYAYPGIGVTGWGETIYNVAVGGTDFEDYYNATKPANGGLPTSTYWSTTNTPTDGSAKSYIPEVPWNDSCAGYLIYNLEGYSTPASTSGFCNSTTAKTNNAFLSTGAGSGGPSACATGGTNTDQTMYLEVADNCQGYAKPSWQSGVFGNPADGVRDIPDVALFASNGFWGHYAVVCWSDTANGGTACTGVPSTWDGFGGTSVATPMMAAIQALVNEYRGLNKIGNPNPTYYAIANAEYGASGNANCTSVSIGTNIRRGLGSSCVFQDVTQGDNNVDCRANGTSHRVNCYVPSSTNGNISTQPLTTITKLTSGSGYTTAPTCTLGAPSNLNKYLSPPNPTVTTIWAGGTQATCTATISGGAVNTLTLSNTGQGYAGGTSCTITGGGGSGATCVASATAATLAPTYQPAYGATPGWDFATGLGTVNAYNLALAPQW